MVVCCVAFKQLCTHLTTGGELADGPQRVTSSLLTESGPFDISPVGSHALRREPST